MKHDDARPETWSADTLDLRAFCLVVDHGSITGAAKTLGETKGSVSRRVSRLERALGATLLRRSPRLVQATDDGLVYRARIGRALELVDDANAELRRAAGAPRGHLRVTAPTDIGLAVAAPIVAAFVERHPEVSVELVLTEALLDFDAHQIDIALRAGSALRDSALVAHKLEDIEGKLFASPEYIATNGAPAKPADLAHHRLLAKATRGAAVLSLRRAGDERAMKVRVRAAISANDFSFTQEAARLGGGIALLPDNVAERDVREGRLVPVMKEWVGLSAALYLVHHATRLLPAKVQAFRAHVLEAFAARKPRAAERVKARRR